jgi:hypothetical protein
MSERANEPNDEVFNLIVSAIRESEVDPVDAASIALDIIRALNEAEYKIEKESADAFDDGDRE